MVLNGQIYRLQHYTGPWNGGNDHFVFYKTKYLVDQYQAFFEEHPAFAPEHISSLAFGTEAAWCFGLNSFIP